jgi:hypothetical protein
MIEQRGSFFECIDSRETPPRAGFRPEVIVNMCRKVISDFGPVLHSRQNQMQADLRS